MALVPPIDHEYLVSMDTSFNGTQNFSPASRAIPANGSQTLRIRMWIMNTTGNKASYLDYTLLGKNISGTASIITTGVNNVPYASANPEAECRIEEGDDDVQLVGALSAQTMQFNLVTVNADRRLIYALIRETTITWT